MTCEFMQNPLIRIGTGLGRRQNYTFFCIPATD